MAMPRTMAKTTAEAPTIRLTRAPYMMAERTSRPCSSEPNTFDQVPSAMKIGGLKLSSRDREAMSNGSCGARIGAKAAPIMQTAAMKAERMASGE